MSRWFLVIFMVHLVKTSRLTETLLVPFFLCYTLYDRQKYQENNLNKQSYFSVYKIETWVCYESVNPLSAMKQNVIIKERKRSFCPLFACIYKKEIKERSLVNSFITVNKHLGKLSFKLICLLFWLSSTTSPACTQLI